MKKFLLSSLCAFFAATSAFAAPLMERVENDALINRIQSNQPGIVNAVYKTEIAGLFEVHTEDRQVLYTNDEGKYFLFNAQLVDFKTKTNFTQERKARNNLIGWDKLPMEAAFIAKKGNGERKLAVFSDPDCPYCKRLENDLVNVDNVTIYYFMLPIDSLHPKARAKSIAVWCSKDKVAAWNDMMLNTKLPEANSTCDHPLNTIAAFAKKFRINSTPTLINITGRLIEGSPKMPVLEEFLNQK